MGLGSGGEKYVMLNIVMHTAIRIPVKKVKSQHHRTQMEGHKECFNYGVLGFLFIYILYSLILFYG